MSRPWRQPRRQAAASPPPPAPRHDVTVHYVPDAEPDPLALQLAEGAGAAKALEAAARRLEQEASHDHRADLEDWGCARCALMEEAARIVRSLGRGRSDAVL